MGTTQKGDRCRRNAVDGSDYCNAHSFQAGTEPEWKNRPEGAASEDAGAETKAGANAGDTHGKREEWSWSECFNFDNDTTRWAAIGFAAVGLMMLFRRR
jgi:hypothetical protein